MWASYFDECNFDVEMRGFWTQVWDKDNDDEDNDVEDNNVELICFWDFKTSYSDILNSKVLKWNNIFYLCYSTNLLYDIKVVQQSMIRFESMRDKYLLSGNLSLCAVWPVQLITSAPTGQTARERNGHLPPHPEAKTSNKDFIHMGVPEGSLCI